MLCKNIGQLILLSVITSSCALWPYKRDFDCPVKEGLKCKSLYEVSVMADKGMFGPHANKPVDEKAQKTKRLRVKRAGKCNVS
jgi:hypothetical protein